MQSKNIVNKELEDILIEAIRCIFLNSSNAYYFFFDVMETVFLLGNINLSYKVTLYLEYIYENIIKESSFPLLFKEKYKNLLFQNINLRLFENEETNFNQVHLTSSYFENKI